MTRRSQRNRLCSAERLFRFRVVAMRLEIPRRMTRRRAALLAAGIASHGVFTSGCHHVQRASVQGQMRTKMSVTEDALRASGVPLSAIKILKRYAEKLDSSGWKYPWPELDQAVKSMPGGKLRLVGYGSLLNRESAARTIKDTPLSGHPPVLALGAKRVFDYIIPEARLNIYGRSEARERGALNVHFTASSSDALNGRLLLISIDDLAALREREFGYDLCPVSCLRWLDWQSAPFTGYVLSATQTHLDGRRILDDQVLPNPAYARVCREGARAVSEAFLRLYLRTTFLADGRTTLEQWELRHPGMINP